MNLDKLEALAKTATPVVEIEAAMLFALIRVARAAKRIPTSAPRKFIPVELDEALAVLDALGGSE